MMKDKEGGGVMVFGQDRRDATTIEKGLAEIALALFLIAAAIL